MLQVAEGGMQTIDGLLIRMMELAEQAATGLYSDAQRVIMDAEFSEMADEIERISSAANFNGISMLDEAPMATNTVQIHVGTPTTINVDKANMTKVGLNIETNDGGWQVDSSTAAGVSATTDTWLTVNQGTGGNTAVTLTISFEDNGASANDELDIKVALTVSTSAPTTFTLDDIVTQINAVSSSFGLDASGNDLSYDAASAYLDTTSSTYSLRIDSRGTDADQYSMSLSGLSTTAPCGSVSGGFTITEAEAVAGSTSVTDNMQAGVTRAGLNILTVAAATSAMTIAQNAINIKDAARAAFGNKMNRLESTIAIVNVQAENLLTAESRISDVAVAVEMANLTRTQVLSQAGIAMLVQANSMPQMALTLLR